MKFGRFRGSMIRNTSWIIAVVVYVGKESKIMKNMVNAPFKVLPLAPFLARELHLAQTSVSGLRSLESALL